MTTQKTENSQNNPAHKTTASQGIDRIFRTGWGKSAAWRKKGGNIPFIPSQQSHAATNRQATFLIIINAVSVQYFFFTITTHDTPVAYRSARPATASRTASALWRLKPGATVKTISHDMGNRSKCRRKTSLMIRLILFRCTAPRMSLCTLIPRRLCEKSFARKISENPFPFSRFPFLYTREYSYGFLRRFSLGSPDFFTSLCRQSFSSFSPSSPDYSLSSSGTHSLPESVGTFTFNIAWLKCSFTHGCFLLFLDKFYCANNHCLLVVLLMLRYIFGSTPATQKKNRRIPLQAYTTVTDKTYHLLYENFLF